MNNHKIALIVGAILFTSTSFSSENMVSKISKHAHQHSHDEVHKKNNIKNKEVENKKIENEKIYICPMHPEIMSEEKGKCPICGMKLKEVDLEEE